MRRTIVSGAVLALVVVFAGAAGWAAMREGPRGGPGGLARALIRLDLSAEQKRGIAGILKAHREEIRRLMEEGAAARKNVAGAVDAPRFDDASVREAVRRASGVAEEAAVLRARIRSEVAGVLTPEQARTLSEMRAAAREGLGGRSARISGFIDEWIAVHGK